MGATICKDGTCSGEVWIRTASAVAAITRLDGIWRWNANSFATMFKLYKSFVTAILLYGCETWTKGPDFWNQVHEETSLHPLLGAQDQRLGAEQDQLLCGATGTSSGNCQETETCTVRACHATICQKKTMNRNKRYGQKCVHMYKVYTYHSLQSNYQLGKKGVVRNAGQFPIQMKIGILWIR